MESETLKPCMPSEEKRDPKLDPVAGDVFRKGGSTVTMTSNSGSFDFQGWLNEAPPMPRWDEEWLPDFRKWAATAEVITRGDA